MKFVYVPLTVKQKDMEENAEEIIKNVWLRLEFLRPQELPFVSRYNWAGFVSQGLA